MTARSDGDVPPQTPGSPGRGRVEHRTARRSLGWLSWLLGFAILAAVIIVALHLAEERELVRITERAQPWWLAVAVVLQVATYLAQGETWRVVTRAARVRVPLGSAFKLSLAKLFVDQALPSGGISGTLVVARALERRGVPRPVVMAAVVVDTVSYYAAFLPALAVAVMILIARGNASPVIVAAALLFGMFSALMTAAALVLSGRRSIGPAWLGRIPLLLHAIELLGDADPKLVRNLRLTVRSGVFQLAIVLLDAATIWFLILSLGEVASPTGVFASFIVSTLLRTLSIIPGGLGAFEAASVVTLRVAGVPLTVALAATLLFRGLSFWLPMVPGLIASRSARRAGGPPRGPLGREARIAQ